MTSLLGYDFEFEVSNICEDSRKVIPGSIFVCIDGINLDGHDYALSALSNGAKHIFANRDIEGINSKQITIVKDTKSLFAQLNSAFYGFPERELSIIGVTGTDGKTSTSTVIKDMLKHDLRIAYLGTNGLEFNSQTEYLGYTTPPSDILFKKMREIVNLGAKVLCMEVSSMALDQRRCEGLEFDVSIFTNLSHEHLDVHKTMEHYFESKALLFDKMRENGKRIINIDDQHGKLLLGRHQPEVISYGIDEKADFFATNIEYGFSKTEFDLIFEDNKYHIVSPLIAKYNVYNLLSAIATCYSYGFSIGKSLEMISNIEAIDGRMHVYQEDITTVVDFAHTPNSLEKLIIFAKTITKGQVWVVFGSAGGRDHEKRPLMGAVASKYADKVIITNDDPRFEDPKKIMDEIAAACSKDNYEIIESRSKAIEYAVLHANENDTVLVTGKGNEDFQLVKGQKLYYNDIEEVINSLSKRKSL